MSLKVYDADQVTVSVAGRPIDSGYADGEFVRVEFRTPQFTTVVGTDGQVTRSKTRDKRAFVTLRLMQSSDGNAVLSALLNMDVLTPNGAGVGSLLIRDRNGTTIYTAAECWVEGHPAASFDRAATAREWRLECAELIAFTGGN